MSSVASRRRPSDTSIVVKYTACAKTEISDDEFDNISILERDNNGSDIIVDEENNTSVPVTANGPRHIQGPGGASPPTDRTKLIGERLSAGDRISLSSPIYSTKVVEQTSSRQSLIDIFNSKLDRVKTKKRSRADSIFWKKPKLIGEDVTTSREIRRIRKKDIAEKFGKKANRQAAKQQQDWFETATTHSEKEGCNWTFVFDPAGRLGHWWSGIVSLAFLYNFWIIIYRFAFHEINSENIGLWFALDYSADFLYVLDIAFHFRTGFLEDGVLQTDPVKLRLHYMNTTTFYIDCLCLLPLDFLYLSIGFYSILRFFRLVKVYRYWAFLDRTERHTNYPNVIRTLTLMHYLLALFHWNACFYYIVATKLGKSSETWRFPKDDGDVLKQYLHGLYWSTLSLTTIGDPPKPRTTGDYFFTIFEMLFGLLLFATVLGHIANIVASVSAARKDFQDKGRRQKIYKMHWALLEAIQNKQSKLDGVKTYMTLRRVPIRLQDRVIKWFDYLWVCNKSTDEDTTLCLLPDKLKAEIAIHVHLDTLKRVEIFQNTEAGFLCELVLRLRPVLFSPGDYICRKGEVGKEMYIVNKGRLHVVADNGKTVLATLKPGSYFGEISILNMGTAGNRRTASVRSVGYSDLFRLSKGDLWDVLKEYPAARVKLEAIAVKRLEKYKKVPLEKASLPRSQSTPGLVESAGKVPIGTILTYRHNTLPSGIIASNRDANSDPGDQLSYRIDPEEEAARNELNPSVETQSTTVETNTVTASSGQSLLPPLISHMYPTTPRYVLSPPPSPRVTCSPTFAPAYFNTYVTNVPDIVSQGSSAQVSPVHIQMPFPAQIKGTNYLNPMSGSVPYPPPSPGLLPPGMGNLNTSHTNLVPPIQHPGYLMSPQMAHTQTISTPTSPYMTRDPNQEFLMQEITRLRERLAMLEGENATMSVKLNQQQWDVENRLAEIELHVCPTESVTSSDEKSDLINPANKESMI